MAKIVLDDSSTNLDPLALNENFRKIEEAFNEDVLYRDNPVGEPNEMDNDLDMNSNRIYNLPKPIADHEPARLIDLTDGIPVRQFLRVEDSSLAPIGDIEVRKNKLLYFDNEGNPETKFPSDDSATQLRIDLSEPTGSSLVGFMQSGVGSTSRTALSKMRDIVSVKDFGAVGDGVTDDTAAIQAAVSSGAKRVFLPAAVYKITSTIQIPSDREIFGEGDSSEIVLHANSSMMLIDGESNVNLRRFKLNGQSLLYTSVTNNGIFIDWRSSGGSLISIYEVTVTDVAGVGVIGLASSGTLSSKINIHKCTVENTGAHGIITQDYIDDVVICNNTVKYTSLNYADRPGITVGRSGKRSIVTNNLCLGSGDSIGTSVHGISLDNTTDAVCANNIVQGWTGYGIEIGGVLNGSVKGNVISGCLRASIALSGKQDQIRSANITIADNACNDNLDQGIYGFMQFGDGTYLHENITVVGNTINGTQNHDGIAINFVSGLTIASNTVSNAFLCGLVVVDCKNIFIGGNNITLNNCQLLKDVTSLTASGAVATASVPNHGYSNGDVITIFGAVPSEYNVSVAISGVTTNTFNYPLAVSPGIAAVGQIKCTKPNSLASSGIRVVWQTITTKENCVFGVNLVKQNGFRDIYDIGVNGMVGFVNGLLYLDECVFGPRAENLTSGIIANEGDRAALLLRNNKLAIAYNNSGVVNYATIKLDGGTTAWTNGSTSP